MGLAPWMKKSLYFQEDLQIVSVFKIEGKFTCNRLIRGTTGLCLVEFHSKLSITDAQTGYESVIKKFTI
jgi:hypothetical protein